MINSFTEKSAPRLAWLGTRIFALLLKIYKKKTTTFSPVNLYTFFLPISFTSFHILLLVVAIGQTYSMAVAKIFALTTFVAYVQATSAAMPGLGVTAGFGVPIEAALGSDSWEDCSNVADDGGSTWPFSPADMSGCKAKCKELYPDASSAQFLMEKGTPKCCCQGLTKAQSEMTWCHYPEDSSAYYWLTCDTMAEPKPCGPTIQDDSLTKAQKLAIYQNGTWDCKAAPTLTPSSLPSSAAPTPSSLPSSAATNNGALTILSSLAPLFLILLAFYRS